MQHSSLEDTIQSYKVSIKNGSISHAHLLERLPNRNSQIVNQVAQKFLKTTSFLANGQCTAKNIPSVDCISFLESKDLPNDSQLKRSCETIDHQHYAFRKLLPANYKDGFYQMKKSGLPNPLKISEVISNNGNSKEDEDNNLAFIQWSQFIEHDLVKGVVSTMRKYFKAKYIIFVQYLTLF